MIPDSDWLAARAAATPGKLALVIGEHRLDYRTLDAEVTRLANRLASAGVRPGSMVGSLLPSSLAAVCLIHALGRLGAVLIPLNIRLTPAELAGQLALVDPGVIVVTAGWRDRLEAATADRHGDFIELPPGLEEFRSFLGRTSATRRARSPVRLDQAQAIVFTSGTSGSPKGAILTWSNHHWSAVGSAFRLGVLPDDRWLACMPLYHVGGLAIVLRSCLYGTAMILHDSFDEAAVWSALAVEQVSHVSLVPTMLHRLLARYEGQAVPGSLRLALIGGAALTPALHARAAAAGVPVAPTYGLTEASSQVATMLPVDAGRKPGSVGRPLMFTKASVVDEAGDELPPGEVGTIMVSGPTVMAGYYRPGMALPEDHADEPFNTGDLGYLDGDGDLWIVDRRNDLIISGGENVYPTEVERVLLAYPGVAAAAVVGLPDAEWGQQVAALIVPAVPGAVAVDGLEAHCRGHLAGYKAPRLIRLADDMPTTASGKIARNRVVETFLVEEVAT